MCRALVIAENLMKNCRPLGIIILAHCYLAALNRLMTANAQTVRPMAEGLRGPAHVEKGPLLIS